LSRNRYCVPRNPRIPSEENDYKASREDEDYQHSRLVLIPRVKPETLEAVIQCREEVLSGGKEASGEGGGVLAWGRGDFIEELVEADRGEGVFALTVDGIGESCCGRDLLL